MDIQPAVEILADAANAVTAPIGMAADALEWDLLVPGDVPVIVDIMIALGFQFALVVLQLAPAESANKIFVIHCYLVH
jgi:hypothetical protein